MQKRMKKPVNGLNMATLSDYRTDTHRSHCLRWLDSSPEEMKLVVKHFRKLTLNLRSAHVNQCHRHTNT